MRTVAPLVMTLVVLHGTSVLADDLPMETRKRVNALLGFRWPPGGSFELVKPGTPIYRKAGLKQVEEFDRLGFFLPYGVATQSSWKLHTSDQDLLDLSKHTVNFDARGNLQAEAAGYANEADNIRARGNRQYSNFSSSLEYLSSYTTPYLIRVVAVPGDQFAENPNRYSREDSSPTEMEVLVPVLDTRRTEFLVIEAEGKVFSGKLRNVTAKWIDFRRSDPGQGFQVLPLKEQYAKLIEAQNIEALQTVLSLGRKESEVDPFFSALEAGLRSESEKRKVYEKVLNNLAKKVRPAKGPFEVNTAENANLFTKLVSLAKAHEGLPANAEEAAKRRAEVDRLNREHEEHEARSRRNLADQFHREDEEERREVEQQARKRRFGSQPVLPHTVKSSASEAECRGFFSRLFSK